MAGRAKASHPPGEGVLPVVWRVGRAGRVLAGAGVGAAAAAVLGAAVWVLAAPSADPGAAVVVTGVSLVIGLALWRTGLYPAVVATEDGLVLRNPAETVSIQWRDIVAVEPGYDGLVVSSATAPPKVAWAVQKANLSMWRGAHTRADAVATEIWRSAEARGAVGIEGRPDARLPQRVSPHDAARHPLPFPWRMTRAEAVVIDFLRHSSSPWVALFPAVLFASLVGVFVGIAIDERWDDHLLDERGVVVQASVVAVPGLVEVTWPAIRPETIYLEPPADARYGVGQTVEIVSDPLQPRRARLAPHHRPWSAWVIPAGTVFLASGYVKWWLWLVVARRSRHSLR